MRWSRFPTAFPFRFGRGSNLPTFTPASPTTTVIDDTQIVSIHTNTGTQLYQFLGNELIDLTWSRESRTPSRCEITIPPATDYHRIPDLIPWQHWISVWDNTGQQMYWTGPIQKIAANRETMTISGRDLTSLNTRTRCPISKRWDATEPADIAAELVTAMTRHHGLRNAAPTIRHDPQGDRFDYQAIADERMLDALMDELVNFGLHWTVVAGTPILGPQPSTPIAALNENDFVGGGISLVRDGRQYFNNVLLRSADSIAQARVPLGTIDLQTIVNIDSMFGVSNTDRAVKQYCRYVSTIRDTITIPDNAVLHPNAPVHISQLIPSTRMVVDAYGIQVLMQLTGVDVRCTPQAASVSIRLESVDDELPELVSLQQQNSISGLGGV